MQRHNGSILLVVCSRFFAQPIVSAYSQGVFNEVFIDGGGHQTR